MHEENLPERGCLIGVKQPLTTAPLGINDELCVYRDWRVVDPPTLLGSHVGIYVGTVTIKVRRFDYILDRTVCAVLFSGNIVVVYIDDMQDMFYVVS